jgi:hypothetical protein
MSAAQTVTATFLAASQPQGDQLLIGLRSDPQYRFGVTLYNANGATGAFRLQAMDSSGAGILISDGKGGLVAYRDFTIAAFQQVYLKDDDLALTDPNQRYVLKATRTSTTGTLLAFGTALDRKTNDLVQVADDSQASASQNGIVSYWVAGVSRFDTTYGAHWRTDLRIFNRGSQPRNLYFDYTYLGGGAQHLARIGDVNSNYVTINPNQLLTYDDVIGTLMSQDKRVDLTGSTSGVLRIYYTEDGESGTKPLILGSRNYDDQSSGTAGSQLAVYTGSQVANPGQTLVLSGATENSAFRTALGVFALDQGPVSFRIVAVAPDGTELGSLMTSLSGVGSFGQLSHLTDIPGFTNPGVPVSVRIDSVTGGRVGAYAFTVDLVTLDTNFIQALPQ